MRQTMQRDLILATVKGTKCHPDAEWVYARVRQQLPRVSLGTVYRNLRRLVEQGELVTLETEYGTLHYDGDTSPHAHFVCRECGEISDLFTETGLTESLRHKGYIPLYEKTVLYGLCPHCADKNTIDNDTPKKF